MDTQRLQDILNCPSLPSIPVVAAKVIELTSNPDVKMAELAEQITIDQALSSKVLRTVNSSFYGLRSKCTSIEKALVLLGLGPVKSLVLGFSLTESLKPAEGEGFDYEDYWKRGLHTAIASKVVADTKGYLDETDECFLVGILQDIGMIAMLRAMPQEYTQVLINTGSEHAVLAREEIKKFEVQHAEVGASIGERWKLPAPITVPIRFHERPTACPTAYANTARCVGLGNLIHRVLIASSPSMPLAKLYQRAHSWFGLNESSVDEIISKTGESTRELASVFEVSLGEQESTQDILARADRQLIRLTRDSLAGSYATQEVTSNADKGATGKDDLTGTLDRQGFKQALGQVYSTIKPGEIDVSIVQVSVEGALEIRQSIGQDAFDDVIVGTATILLRFFEPMGGAVCRIGERGFGVVLPEVEQESAIYVAESVREQFARAIKGWIPSVEDLDTLVKVHIGVATLNRSTAKEFETPDKLVLASSTAVKSARAENLSSVRAYAPAAA